MLVLQAPEYASVRVIECSPPSWMVHAVLVEKGLPHRVEWLSFAKGEHKTPAMLAKNPRGTIPVLADGDAIWVSETFAILQYLEDRYPEPALLPSDPALRARAIVRFHESSYVKDLGMALFVRLMKEPVGDTANAWAELVPELERWDRYLEEAPYVAGNDISLADIVVFTYLATATRLGLDTSNLPRLERFAARMAERPSIAATWPWPRTKPQV